MSHRHDSHQPPEVGKVALHLLTIPVMSAALLLAYVALHACVDEWGPLARAHAVGADHTPAAHGPITERELLDPTGAGRNASP